MKQQNIMAPMADTTIHAISSLRSSFRISWPSDLNVILRVNLAMDHMQT